MIKKTWSIPASSLKITRFRTNYLLLSCGASTLQASQKFVLLHFATWCRLPLKPSLNQQSISCDPMYYLNFSAFNVTQRYTFAIHDYCSRTRIRSREFISLRQFVLLKSKYVNHIGFDAVNHVRFSEERTSYKLTSRGGGSNNKKRSCRREKPKVSFVFFVLFQNTFEIDVFVLNLVKNVSTKKITIFVFFDLFCSFLLFLSDFVKKMSSNREY